MMSDNVQSEYMIFGEDEIVQLEGWSAEGTNNSRVDADILEGDSIAATVDFAVQNYSTLLSKLAD